MTALAPSPSPKAAPLAPVAPAPALILVGRDDSGKPHASWFGDADAAPATQAAQAKRDCYDVPELEVCGPTGETCSMALVDGAGSALRVSTRGSRFIVTDWHTATDFDYGKDSSDYYAIDILVVVLIGLGLYLIPSFVAFLRGHPNRWPIMLINVVFAIKQQAGSVSFGAGSRRFAIGASSAIAAITGLSCWGLGQRR